MFKVLNFSVLIEGDFNKTITQEAKVKLDINGKIQHTVAEGNGPVSALNNALKKALSQYFPVIKEVEIEDYQVFITNGKRGADSAVTVEIDFSNGEKTKAKSTDIVQASFSALITGIQKTLNKAG